MKQWVEGWTNWLPPTRNSGERQRARSFVEVINQASEVVMTLEVVDIIAKRSTGR